MSDAIPLDLPLEPPPCTDEANDPTWLARLERVPCLFLPLLVVLCVAFAWRILGAGDDFWAHSAIGRWMVQHRQVPHQTLFIWSAPPIPWVAHSWLTQLVFYALMAVGGERFGPYLALWLTVLLAALPFTMLWRLWLERAALTSLMPIVFTLGVWCAAPRFRPRPEMFTATFFAFLLLFLVRWHPPLPLRHPHASSARSHVPRLAWAVPPLFMVWANFHGAVAVGLMILVLTVVCDLGQDWFDKRSRWLALLAVASVAAVFVNPFGASYWAALKPVHSPMFSRIDEWKPFWEHPKLGVEYAVGEAALVVIALAAWAANPQRRWAHLAWLVLMSVSFVSARRHLWLLALVSLAVMAANAAALDTGRLWAWWWRTTRPRRRAEGDVAPAKPVLLRRMTRLGVVACMTSWIATTTPRDILPLRAVSRFVPRGATRYIQQHHMPGPIFNDYESSSYLQWRLAGHPPLYIDLLNAYPGHILEPDYFDILDAKTNAHGRKLLSRIGYVFLRRHGTDEGMHTLAKYLDQLSKARHPQWKCMYRKPDGTIWVRIGKHNPIPSPSP